jgi:uncharacterized protein YhaN
MTLAALGQMAVTIGIGSIILAIINAYINRNERRQNVENKKAEADKVQAEAQKMLSSGALEWATTMQSDNAEVRTEAKKLKKRLDIEEDHTEALEDVIRRLLKQADKHAEWDLQMVDLLVAHGIAAPAPPVLDTRIQMPQRRTEI